MLGFLHRARGLIDEDLPRWQAQDVQSRASGVGGRCSALVRTRVGKGAIIAPGHLPILDFFGEVADVIVIGEGRGGVSVVRIPVISRRYRLSEFDIVTVVAQVDVFPLIDRFCI